MEEHVPTLDMAVFLREGGWIENHNGWWHPPSCLASWPLGEAYAMAKRDEAQGARMTPEQVQEYLRQ